MALNAGDAQVGVVVTTLPTAYSVVVRDVLGLPVAGVPVSWAVTSGGGSITPAQSTTDAAGIATAIRTLGDTAGTQTATASVSGLTGSPVTFAATALADIPSQVVAVAGTGQTDTVGTFVATAPQARVTDAHGNPVADVPVTFAVTGGGGLVTVPDDTTDAAGLAAVGGWQLGSIAGPNALTATAGGIVTPATFTATGVAGAPTKLAFVTQPIRTLAGDTIEPAVQVAILDAFGQRHGDVPRPRRRLGRARLHAQRQLRRTRGLREPTVRRRRRDRGGARYHAGPGGLSGGPWVSGLRRGWERRVGD
jgi:hypothetical protein